MTEWISEPFDDGTIQVRPIADLREHGLSDCWCHPTPDDDRPDIIVHHSMDRREEYERGERKSS